MRINGLLLAPTGLQSGRFCLPSEATAYLADSEHTALYESIFRRDVHSRSLADLARKSLVTFATKGRLRLADVRALAEPYPVLQAQRIAITQTFAQECRAQQLDGIVYASAQHPLHACIALFASGMAELKKVSSLPLVNRFKLHPMRPSQALSQHRDAVCQAAARYRVANPRVFGSALHGHDVEGSDLDLLVDPLPGTTLFDLGGLQDELQTLLGVSVDVLTPKDLPPKFRDAVVQEARPL